jgi:hypothetical protein
MQRLHIGGAVSQFDRQVSDLNEFLKDRRKPRGGAGLLMWKRFSKSGRPRCGEKSSWQLSGSHQNESHRIARIDLHDPQARQFVISGGGPVPVVTSNAIVPCPGQGFPVGPGPAEATSARVTLSAPGPDASPMSHAGLPEVRPEASSPGRFAQRQYPAPRRAYPRSCRARRSWQASCR